MRKLSILVIHNRYRQPGGEDTVANAEVDLLRRAGHRVVPYTCDNREIADYNPFRKASLLLRASWNQKTYADIRALIRRERPDLAHCHNFFPLVSPSAHAACKRAGIPVVQTLHNYRLLCPAGTSFRDGRRCDRCLRSGIPGVLRGCYRHSRLQTSAVSLMLGAHRLLGSWNRNVDAYLVPSRYCRARFVESGVSLRKIHYKPNFLASDPGLRTVKGSYALFVGRLSPEKGVFAMLQAWQGLRDIPLVVAGDGPAFADMQQVIARSKLPANLLGHLSAGQTLACLKRARFLVFPSLWDEPFGMGLLEAAACGVPSLASRAGAIPELVEDQNTGLLFDPCNFAEFTARARWAWSHPEQMEVMGAAAREMYLRNFTAEKNYSELMGIYSKVLNT